MLKQKQITIKTADTTLNYAEMGDIVCNSLSAIQVTLSSPNSGLWYRISNANSGVVTVSYNGSTLTTLNQNEQCLCLANNTSDWFFSKGGGGGSSVNGIPKGGLTGQILAKNSDTDYDAIWESPSAVQASVLPVVSNLPDSPSDGQTVILNYSTGKFIATYISAVSHWFTTKLQVYYPNAAVYDTFDRADNSSTLGNADTGQAWTNISGIFGISNNKAILITNGGSNNDIASIDSSLASKKITCDITFVTGSNPNILIRYSSASNFIQIGIGSSSFDLYKNVNGSYTKLGTYSYTPVDGTTYHFIITDNGSSISIQIDSICTITATDTNFNTTTKIGLREGANKTNGAKWDNLIVEAA